MSPLVDNKALIPHATYTITATAVVLMCSLFV